MAANTIYLTYAGIQNTEHINSDSSNARVHATLFKLVVLAVHSWLVSQLSYWSSSQEFS